MLNYCLFKHSGAFSPRKLDAKFYSSNGNTQKRHKLGLVACNISSEGAKVISYYYNRHESPVL